MVPVWFEFAVNSLGPACDFQNPLNQHPADHGKREKRDMAKQFRSSHPYPGEWFQGDQTAMQQPPAPYGEAEIT